MLTCHAEASRRAVALAKKVAKADALVEDSPWRDHDRLELLTAELRPPTAVLLLLLTWRAVTGEADALDPDQPSLS